MQDKLLRLVAKQHQPLLAAYLQFWQEGNEHFCRFNNDANIKNLKLRLLEKAMRGHCRLQNTTLAKLQKAFRKENISMSILLDLLGVWRYCANNKFPTSEQQFTDILGYIAAPMARLIMALNNEDPVTYLPMNALISEMMYNQPNVLPIEVSQSVKITLKHRKNKSLGWLKTANVLLEIVRTKRLKWRLALLINRNRMQLKSTLNNKQCTTSLLDEVGIFLYSTYQFMTIRRKTIHNKGI